MSEVETIFKADGKDLTPPLVPPADERRSIVARILLFLKTFFGPTPGTIPGYTTIWDKYRQMITSMIVGGITHALLVVLPLAIADVQIAFGPILGGVVAAFLTYVLEGIRRTFQDGTKSA
jgi:hypothetical protein